MPALRLPQRALRRGPSLHDRCRGCDKRFSVRTGSVMADSKLGYQVWAIATC